MSRWRWSSSPGVTLDGECTDKPQAALGIGDDSHDIGAPPNILVGALQHVGNRYEISRCQRSAAVFCVVAYGATIGTEAPGARCAGRPMHSMSRELELVAGRLCDSPGCAGSANP
ncbi:hypothetical protein ACVWZV_009174 [Bradyrhizobium sp. GM5.1]